MTLSQTANGSAPVFFFFGFEVWEVRFKEMAYLVGLDDEKWI